MPRATNPWAEILNTARWRKSGNLAQLKTKLWRVIVAFEKGLDEAIGQGNGDEAPPQVTPRESHRRPSRKHRWLLAMQRAASLHNALGRVREAGSVSSSPIGQAAQQLKKACAH